MPLFVRLGVALAKLNDPENAMRAYTFSLKLDPNDPMALLNLAVLQSNTGVSQSSIDATIQRFQQAYAQKAAASSNERELDASMFDTAVKLGAVLPASISKSTVPSAPPALDHDTNPLSPREFDESAAHDSEIRKATLQDPPADVRTKIFDDSRHRQRRGKAAASTEKNEEATSL